MENMSSNITAYYAKTTNQKGKRKFLYVELIHEATELFSEQRTTVYASGNKQQVHLTTDGAFERYLSKRKCRPSKVILFDTQHKLEANLAEVGVLL